MLSLPELSNDFLEAHSLPADLTSNRVPAEAVARHLRKQVWQEQHVMERESYSDPTFRDMLATTQHTPNDAPYRRSIPKPVLPRIKTVPVEDLVYELACDDGRISFGRRALMTICTAQRVGRINVRRCTIADIRALIGGGAL